MKWPNSFVKARHNKRNTQYQGTRRAKKPLPAPRTSPREHYPEAKQFDTTTKPLGIHSEEVSGKTQNKAAARTRGKKATYCQKTLGIIERPLFCWFEKGRADGENRDDHLTTGGTAGNSAYDPSRAPITKETKGPQRRLADYGLPVISVSCRQNAFLKEKEACARPTTNNLAE